VIPEASPLAIPPPSPAAGGPLYQQIVDALKREISEGRLRPGQPLPSFRALAEQLLVSLITVKRAYEELEHEGLIYRRQGLGTFVSEDGRERGRAAKQVRARQLLEAALREAAEAGLSRREIQAMIRETIQEQGDSAT
jgi:GntR family transcriptional regulator